MKIEGNSIFSEDQIRSVIGLNKGDIANAEKISKALFENLKKIYGSQGFIEYTAEPVPTFKDNPQKPDEGTVDFKITIEEGKQFTLRRLEFSGNTFTKDTVLRREVLINEGDIYNQGYWDYSVIKLNQSGYFEPIDKDKDADFRTNDEEATVDINLKVRSAAGNRSHLMVDCQASAVRSLVWNIQPITCWVAEKSCRSTWRPGIVNVLFNFHLLSHTSKTGQSQRVSRFLLLLKSSSVKVHFCRRIWPRNRGPHGSTFDFLTVDDENLFTRTSYGGSIFASAPLSEFYRKRRFTQFSRVGASYQFSTSSVTDPEVNVEGSPEQFIPVIYAQPNIITSRGTLTFTYDTRNASVDPTSGRELSIGVALAGLGGDVRTYQPTISYTQFFPMRRKKSERPEVFGFRILAGTVGSFAISEKVANSQSLAFVAGVPIFERFFLGDEFTIRGYNVRSISPIAPLDTFVTSRNVVVAQNSFGPVVAIPGVPASLSTIGTFTGIGGNNTAQLPRSFTPIGGDTQLLGNFEYRIPIIGNTIGLAAFADIGTSFNLRSKTDQFFSSNFLEDQPFLQTVGFIPCARLGSGFAPASLSTLAACNANTQLALTGNLGLVLRDNRMVTTQELDNARQIGPFDPSTGSSLWFSASLPAR